MDVLFPLLPNTARTSEKSYCSIFLSQTLQRSSTSGRSALPASGSERRGEEDSVRVLVLLHARLSYWGAAASHSRNNHTKGPFAQGTTPRRARCSAPWTLLPVASTLSPLPQGACVCASGVVVHAGRLASVPGCG